MRTWSKSTPAGDSTASGVTDVRGHHLALGNAAAKVPHTRLQTNHMHQLLGT